MRPASASHRRPATEILIAFDQPPFTALHQVAHVWLSAELIESRWIREGLASDVAARVAGGARRDARRSTRPRRRRRCQAAAFPLDTWADSADPDGGVLRARRLVGLRRRAARRRRRRRAALGPRSRGRLDRPVRRRRHRADPPDDGARRRRRSPAARSSTTSRRSPAPTSPAASASASCPTADVALLEARAAARAAFDELVATADGWGAPDPVRAAMTDWRFDEALPDDRGRRVRGSMPRDELLREMEAVGLSAPDRLQQAYRSFGGGAEACDELEAAGRRGARRTPTHGGRRQRRAVVPGAHRPHRRAGSRPSGCSSRTGGSPTATCAARSRPSPRRSASWPRRSPAASSAS